MDKMCETKLVILISSSTLQNNMHIEKIYILIQWLMLCFLFSSKYNQHEYLGLTFFALESCVNTIETRRTTALLESGIARFSSEFPGFLDDKGHVPLVRKLGLLSQPEGVVNGERVYCHCQALRVDFGELFPP